MSPTKRRRPFATLLCLCLLAFQASGCGTLMFPHRRGQPRRGKLDPNLLVLDSVLVVFFVVPAVVAYSVDIGTGALWLPAGDVDGEGPFWGESALFDKSVHASDR